MRNGEAITYTVTTSNLDTGAQVACDLTNVTVTLTLPGADGTPSGHTTALASGINYPAGTPLAVLATVPYTVAVNPGVSSVVVRAEARGTLHDAPNDDMAAIARPLRPPSPSPTPPFRWWPSPSRVASPSPSLTPTQRRTTARPTPPSPTSPSPTKIVRR